MALGERRVRVTVSVIALRVGNWERDILYLISEMRLLEKYLNIITFLSLFTLLEVNIHKIIALSKFLLSKFIVFSRGVNANETDYCLL
ncbi:hypothetical protein DSM107003_35010 [Trichormus variabilis SAG 1403-4b]|uniref:Uncharacterized protein n=1 Tax=Trichormus variabilis SAG 1403-4b TaxID=447716 RepID=A0A3S1BTX2_ANAVA|nr:hypothetical protein DSM107003_35010 [Trichormus variabilis SAG 1403-4b]